MTLYYAIGGGLGHRNRARLVLETLGIENAEIMTGAEIPKGLEGDRGGHRQWLADRVRDRHVIVDAFPLGIQGELEGLEAARVDWVARLLQWPSYRSAVPYPPPHFDTAYVVEPLTPPHEAFVLEASARVVPLNLAPPRPRAPTKPIEGSYALIVHSGPAAEVAELVAYAVELGPDPLLVATRCDIDLPSGMRRLDTDRPFDYFEGAVRLVSGAGFNVMLETEPWRHKHHALPFPRRFDDQYLRAARRRKRAAVLSRDEQIRHS